MTSIDLNADLGEDAGTDEEMVTLISSTSIACGGHAGDGDSMAATSALAVDRGVVVGAHPSYPDREGFGRRPCDLSADHLATALRSQVTALAMRADIRFVKAHGALYNRAAEDRDAARVLVDLAGEFDVVLLCPDNSQMAEECQRRGRPWRAEAFADRAYRPDGRLMPRSQPGAVIDDPGQVAERALDLATHGRVRAVDGSWIGIRADSICVHGDTPGAVALARAVRDGLEGAGLEIRPFA